MALQHVTLEAAAKVFRVHPRTILRALSGQHNTYWTEDSNHDRLSVEDIADVYGTTAQTIRAVVEKRDNLLRPDEAAKVLGIRPRTFRDRVQAGRYDRITNGGIVRYLHSKLVTDAIASTNTE